MENVNQAQFWQQRYEQDSIGWDMGQVSPPLQAYIDQLPESAKSQAVLVPGAGNAYEVGYLHEQGFTNVTLVDFAPAPIEAFAERYPDFPAEHLICADFFELSPAQYQFDWVLEQTFFCAINPARRDEYVAHIKDGKCPAGECKALASIEINPELCKGCGICKRQCPVNAISGEIGKPHEIDPDKCIKCIHIIFKAH